MTKISHTRTYHKERAELDCHDEIVEVICSDINTLLTTPYKW